MLDVDPVGGGAGVGVRGDARPGGAEGGGCSGRTVLNAVDDARVLGVLYSSDQAMRMVFFMT